MLPQMIGYVKIFEINKAISFKINDKKVKRLLSIKFGSEPIHGDNDKYIKTKIEIYDVNTNF